MVLGEISVFQRSQSWHYGTINVALLLTMWPVIFLSYTCKIILWLEPKKDMRMKKI